MGLLYRVLLLCLIPYRLAIELYNTYIWRPKLRQHIKAMIANGKNGSANHDSDDDHEVDATRVNPEMLNKLNEAIDKWWGPITPLQGLKAMNKVRIPIIVQAYHKDVLIGRDFDPSILKTPSPLMGAKVCDVGCGGGYLTEALVDAGAEVVGIDENELDVLAAKTHWNEDRKGEQGPEYHHTTVQKFSARHEGEFDVVICSELMEHLTDPMAYLPYVLKLVREGGVVVITTNNRTIAALLFAIIWLEHIAAIIPLNTHHLYQFIRPNEIDTVTRNHGFETKDLVGYLPIGLTARLTWRLQWILTTFTGVWYAQVAKKRLSPPREPQSFEAEPY